MLTWITNVMNSLGYIGVALLMFLENVFPPIPSELIMPLAGFTASQGQLSFWGVVIAGALGSLLGQLPLYYLGKFVGEERLKAWADRYGKWLTVSSDEIDRADGWFDRHGSKTVLFCRLIPGIRSLISIPAGFSDMHMGKFLVYSGIGTTLWTLLLAYLGRLLGQNYRAVEDYLGPITYLVLGLIVVVSVVWVVRRKQKRKAG